MILLNWPRNSGKTYTLVKLAAFHGKTILCPTIHHKHHILNLAKQHGFNIPEPITIHELTRTDTQSGVMRDASYYVDELGACFTLLIRSNVEVATVTDIMDASLINDVIIKANEKREAAIKSMRDAWTFGKFPIGDIGKPEDEGE